MYPESLMNRAGATRLYGDVTVRNFARHSVGLSWSPEKQSIKSWLEDMYDMIMRTADQYRKTSRIWIKKAKQHCCYPFSSLLSFALFIFAELTLSNPATAKVGGASAGQATAHRLSVFLLILHMRRKIHEHQWRSKVPTFIELPRQFPVSFQITKEVEVRG